MFLSLHIVISAEIPNDHSTIESTYDVPENHNNSITSFGVNPQINRSLSLFKNKIRNMQKIYKLIRKNKIQSRNKKLKIILEVLYEKLSFIIYDPEREDILEFLNYSAEQINNFIKIYKGKGPKDDDLILQERIVKIVSELEDFEIFLSNLKNLDQKVFRLTFYKYKLNIFEDQMKKLKDELLAYTNFRKENDINVKFKKILKLNNLKKVFHYIEEKISLVPEEFVSCILIPFKEDLSGDVTNLYVELFLYLQKDNRHLSNIIKHLENMDILNKIF